MCYFCWQDQIQEFFKPLVPMQVHIPKKNRKSSGKCCVDFFSVSPYIVFMLRYFAPTFTGLSWWWLWCRTCNQHVTSSTPGCALPGKYFDETSPTDGHPSDEWLCVGGKPSRYVTSSESWGVNRHTTWCTGSVSVVWQCKLVSGWLPKIH